MSRVLLFDNEEINLFDFTVIGISCHLKDYQLCWNINKHLGFNFVKSQHYLEISVKKTISKHSFYTFASDENSIAYWLIKNRTEGLMIPEQPNADYFLKIEGETNNTKLLEQLKNTDGVLTAFVIDINTLKSKENFIF